MRIFRKKSIIQLNGYGIGLKLDKFTGFPNDKSSVGARKPAANEKQELFTRFCQSLSERDGRRLTYIITAQPPPEK